MSVPTTIDEAIRRLESIRPGVAVSIADRLYTLPGDDARRFSVFVEVSDGEGLVGRGRTRMEALQDAMREVQAWHEETLAQPPAVEPGGQLSLWPTR